MTSETSYKIHDSSFTDNLEGERQMTEPERRAWQWYCSNPEEEMVGINRDHESHVPHG